MSTNNLDAIYGQIDALPSLPVIVNDVLEVTSDPESSANDLMKAILPDQSMCATILKIANSAFFGLPREVATIDKAVMVLGFDEVKNIVLGKAVFNSFKDLDNLQSITLEDFWDHAFTCGLAAKIIAERIDISPSQMFIAGLIHDIGKLAMLLTFPNIYSHLLNIADDSWLQNCDKENELFFIAHDEVAHRILNRWLFPESLLQAVGYHHRPDEAQLSPLLASVIQIADIISHTYQSPDGAVVADYRSMMEKMRPDLFNTFDDMQVPCSNEEITLWFDRLKVSKEEDTGILGIFTS